MGHPNPPNATTLVTTIKSAPATRQWLTNQIWKWTFWGQFRDCHKAWIMRTINKVEAVSAALLVYVCVSVYVCVF